MYCLCVEEDEGEKIRRRKRKFGEILSENVKRKKQKNA
jgi:hypothetical protein